MSLEGYRAVGMRLHRQPITMAAAHRPRALLIDDDPGVRDVVSCLLAEFGFECQTADDGASGVARFEGGG